MEYLYYKLNRRVLTLKMILTLTFYLTHGQRSFTKWRNVAIHLIPPSDLIYRVFHVIVL